MEIIIAQKIGRKYFFVFPQYGYAYDHHQKSPLLFCFQMYDTQICVKISNYMHWYAEKSEKNQNRKQKEGFSEVIQIISFQVLKQLSKQKQLLTVLESSL